MSFCRRIYILVRWLNGSRRQWYSGGEAMSEDPFVRNCLNGLALNSSVYRVFPAKRLAELFLSKKLTLVVPRRWDDPFENMLEKARAVNEGSGEQVSLERLFQNVYGQCWCWDSDETDATWRIYSPDKSGVRVKVNAQKLFEIIVRNQGFALISSFIGKVRYASKDEILATLRDPDQTAEIALRNDGAGSARWLMSKRLEFAHEKEVRLLFWDRENIAGGTDIIQFDCEPTDLVEEVVLDPRMSDSDVALWTGDFKALGYHNSITKSDLYSPPDLSGVRIRLG